jgi:hypothetical protein
MALNVATWCQIHRDWTSNIGLSRLGLRSWALEIEPLCRPKNDYGLIEAPEFEEWVYSSPLDGVE